MIITIVIAIIIIKPLFYVGRDKYSSYLDSVRFHIYESRKVSRTS
jgi:hypothetical protein